MSSARRARRRAIQELEFKHTELIMEVETAETGELRLYNLGLDRTIAPFLRSNADNWEAYQITSVKLHYEPVIGTDRDGIFAGCFVNLGDELPTKLSEIAIRTHSNAAAVYAPMELDVTNAMKDFRGKWKLTAQSAPQALSVADLSYGTIVVGAQADENGIRNDPVGLLWIEYHVKFRSPRVGIHTNTPAYESINFERSLNQVTQPDALVAALGSSSFLSFVNPAQTVHEAAGPNAITMIRDPITENYTNAIVANSSVDCIIRFLYRVALYTAGNEDLGQSQAKRWESGETYLQATTTPAPGNSQPVLDYISEGSNYRLSTLDAAGRPCSIVDTTLALRWQAAEGDVLNFEHVNSPGYVGNIYGHTLEAYALLGFSIMAQDWPYAFSPSIFPYIAKSDGPQIETDFVILPETRVCDLPLSLQKVISREGPAGEGS